jgi:hypothetical protein
VGANGYGFSKLNDYVKNCNIIGFVLFRQGEIHESKQGGFMLAFQNTHFTITYQFKELTFHISILSQLLSVLWSLV